MKPSANTTDFVLPGYTLSDRLGEGGYGEVWRAEAPGGLTKAVKIVFGNYQDKRAVHELKALERIKEVRHPFLLSLERIEVVDGRLIIVTELADCSLKDRFDQCIEEGLPGIPKEELLGYVRDAAEALDYLSNQYQLQHLDVKPENLLLVAGHVKVADFGLVKDVQNTQASLVGGLTPIYSAPEVFQGKPGTQSDQYSLAVLYQEMLTDTRPFPGVTAAELTLQHIHEEPDLLPLPASVRYVLARALSKDPKRRFASCSDLVQTLEGKSDQVSLAPSQANSPEANPSAAPFSPKLSGKRPARPVSATQIYEVQPEEAVSSVSDSMLLEVPKLDDTHVTTLPALVPSAELFQPSPVLVLGIGGTACSVLQHYQGLLHKKFGGDLPTIQTLLLDTDSKTIRDATQAEGENALSAQQTLSLPLRRPQEYRQQSGDLLQWLSRRWLYNIPRSLQTEGLRPLGRLAFVDHAGQAIQRIRMALKQATDAQSIETASKRTDLKFRTDAVRVYVVASISGGTGSGISLDIGYVVRHLLAQLGIANATTLGLAAYSTGCDSRQRDLAKVNAYSWLSEWNHYRQPEGGFPGEPAYGLPALEPAVPAFDNTYLVHLGERLEPDQFDQATEALARYLYLDTLSPAQPLLDACRDEPTPHESSRNELRTFGLYRQTAAPQEVVEAIAGKICHGVVLGWTGNAPVFTQDAPQSITDVLSLDQSFSETKAASTQDTSQHVRGAPQFVSQLQLGLEQVATTARVLILEKFGGNVEDLLQKLVRDASVTSEKASFLHMTQVVDNLFAAPEAAASDDTPPNTSYVLGCRLGTIVSPLGMKLAGDLRQWILAKLDQPTERLSGARRATDWLAEHMQSVSTNAMRLADGISRQLAETIHQASALPKKNSAKSNPPQPNASAEQVLQYFRYRLDQSALQAADELARILHAELRTTSEALTEFGRHLSHLAESFAESGSPSLVKELLEKLACQLPELTQKIDAQLQTEIINNQGGLFATVMSRGKVHDEMMAQLQHFAARQVEQAIREIKDIGEGAGENLSEDLFAQSHPKLLEHGGQTRQLAILPQSDWTVEQLTQWAKQLGPDATLVEGDDNVLTVCCEASGLPLIQIATELIQRRRDYADFADRVHTRNDIEWTSLTETKREADRSSQPFATEVL